MPADRALDLAIIGAGIAGVIHLHYARQLFQLDVVLAGVVVVGIVGYALDRALAAIEARLGRWRQEAF